jgi:uncharacterized protein (UPF0548 family)
VWRSRRPSDEELGQIAQRLGELQPTFAAADRAAPGFHHDEWRRELRVATTWTQATDALKAWAAHTSAGARVRPHAEPVAGLTVALAVRVGPAWVVAGCRVTEVVDTAREYGFTYVTLPGHPERGEESFTLRLGHDGRITFTIAATSKPADLLARLGTPVARTVQRRTSQRYLDLGGLG